MDIQTRVLMEGNLANEVGLVVLDTIELFCGHFKVSALYFYFSVVGFFVVDASHPPSFSMASK